MKNPDLRTANLLGALALALTDQIRDEIELLSDQGETDCAALVTIHHESGLSLDRLAMILRLSQPGTVRLVDRLTAADLVDRRPGPDRRTRALVLTEKGRLRARTILFGRERAIQRAMDALSPEQKKVLPGAIEAMLGALTGTEQQAFSHCRLCDEAVCAKKICPVEQAFPG